ncbi:hypothetical protein ULMS_05980 [Patiriisocius marinistellae]|uniref:Lipoprotein n=1 Tax=Patiriisocius marinistellae TaxID=2494560 RepID=A0A5J4FTR2_9FLAO|nr:hypothetical protein [Patiriisocius marinistellae]GEQ85090.1 hypothetical protein ULMS_05980 [Patiriisocius marinistellae]
MKPINIILILAITFQSCTSSSEKDKLIGNWSVPNALNEFEFYKDSLIVNEWGMSYINKWNIDQSKLYLKPIKGLDSFAIKTNQFDYRLSHNLDTLFIKRETDSVFGPAILRIKSAFDYQLKRNYLTVDLPRKQNLEKEPKSSIGLNIYVGYNNGKLVAKSDDDKHLDLTDLKFFAYEYMAMTEEGIQDNLHYNLIADKKITAKELDSVRNILKQTNFSDIFRVYTNDKVDYNKTDWKDELVWYGRME